MLPVPIPACNPGPMTGSGNWTYLVPGETPCLIDAGVGKADHLDAIAAEAPGGPARVLVSHAHRDHVSGAGALHERFPSAVFFKHPWPEKDPDIGVPWQPLEDGQIVPAGDDELVAIHTPGHAPDHMIFWHAGTRTAFTGDLVVRGSSVMIPASSGGSLVAYLQSLKKLLALAPARVLPAHGPVVDDPAALIQQYLDHRHQREVQVLTALESGYETVDAITGRIYANLADALAPMARETVLAHLVKLEHDGLARADAGGWRVLR